MVVMKKGKVEREGWWWERYGGDGKRKGGGRGKMKMKRERE
jgi:hypothetical protein